MYNTKRDVLLVRVESETANKLPLLIPILGTTTSTIYPLYSYTGTGTISTSTVYYTRRPRAGGCFLSQQLQKQKGGGELALHIRRGSA